MNINELNRFKLLMEYDVKKTLTENLKPIVEQSKVIKNLIQQGGKQLDDVITKGLLKTTQNTAIKSIDDLKAALKPGSSAPLLPKSNTLLTNTFLKNPSIGISDKKALIKTLTNSDDVIKRYRNLNQTQVSQKFKAAGYPDDVADEIAAGLKNRTAGSTQGLTSKQTAEYKKLADSEKARRAAAGQNTKLGQGTRESLIKQVITKNGKPKNLRAKSPKPKNLDNAKVKNKFNKVKNQGWNWGRWLKWGAGLGLTALGVWWLLRDSEEPIVPDDIPEESPIEDETSQSQYRVCPEEMPIAYGCRNNTIKRIQVCLGLTNDGKFGPKTKQALINVGDTGDKIDGESFIKACAPGDAQPETTPETTPETKPIFEPDDTEELSATDILN